MIPQLDLAQQQAFIRSLAPARLTKFRAVFGGRDRDAVELYLLDAALVSHLHAVTRTVEVALREAMHGALTAQYGPRWYNSQASHLDNRTLKMISEAKQKLEYKPAPGKVVAQLMLGAWVSLLDRGGTLKAGSRADYEAHLWDPAVRSVFSRGGLSPTRSDIHGLAQSINWARNRINHCEPVVFGFPQLGQSGTSKVQDRHSPARVLEDMRQLTHHLDPTLGAWLAQPSAVDVLIADSKAQLALNYAKSMPGVNIVH